MRGEPIAYILGHKEFFGLDFKVNRHTLIPRPETELLVEEVLKLNPGNATLVDVGTGSGNIIISLAKKLKARNKFMGIDISKKTLVLAKQNAQLHRVDKKIKFMKGDMLSPIINNLRVATGLRVIITANLPYLSKNIYSRVSRDIIKYEPKSALLSGKEGLAHYEKLLKHIKKLQKRCFMLHVSCFMEISPEQKNALQKMIKKHFPQAQTSFSKDLSGRWRLGQISLD
jgi:release factor glutamine methyltransferase